MTRLLAFVGALMFLMGAAWALENPATWEVRPPGVIRTGSTITWVTEGVRLEYDEEGTIVHLPANRLLRYSLLADPGSLTLVQNGQTQVIGLNDTMDLGAVAVVAPLTIQVKHSDPAWAPDLILPSGMVVVTQTPSGDDLTVIYANGPNLSEDAANYPNEKRANLEQLLIVGGLQAPLSRVKHTNYIYTDEANDLPSISATGPNLLIPFFQPPPGRGKSAVLASASQPPEDCFGLDCCCHLAGPATGPCGTPAASATKRKTLIVYVGGLMTNDPETTMHDLQNHPNLKNNQCLAWKLFPYEYEDSLAENGLKLAKFLNAIIQKKCYCKIIVAGQSGGGCVVAASAHDIETDGTPVELHTFAAPLGGLGNDPGTLVGSIAPVPGVLPAILAGSAMEVATHIGPYGRVAKGVSITHHREGQHGGITVASQNNLVPGCTLPPDDHPEATHSGLIRAVFPFLPSIPKCPCTTPVSVPTPTSTSESTPSVPGGVTGQPGPGATGTTGGGEAAPSTGDGGTSAGSHPEPHPLTEGGDASPE